MAAIVKEGDIDAPLINEENADLEDNEYDREFEEEDSEKTIALKAQTTSKYYCPDPWEKYNRRMFNFNNAFDRKVIKPIANIYLRDTNIYVRYGVGNFADNLLFTPQVVLFSVIQLDLEAALISFWKFVLNMTLGIGGVYDIASASELPAIEKSLGQTLSYYGVKTGNYLVLPVIGSSTLRDSLSWPILSLLNSHGGINFLGYSDRANITYFYVSYRSGIGQLVAGKSSGLIFTLWLINLRATLMPFTNDLDSNNDRYLAYRDSYIQRSAYKTAEENNITRKKRFYKNFEVLPVINHQWDNLDTATAKTYAESDTELTLR